jgi:hypothetical protein
MRVSVLLSSVGRNFERATEETGRWTHGASDDTRRRQAESFAPEAADCALDLRTTTTTCSPAFFPSVPSSPTPSSRHPREQSQKGASMLVATRRSLLSSATIVVARPATSFFTPPTRRLYGLLSRDDAYEYRPKPWEKGGHIVSPPFQGRRRVRSLYLSSSPAACPERRASAARASELRAASVELKGGPFVRDRSPVPSTTQ